MAPPSLGPASDLWVEVSPGLWGEEVLLPLL